MNVSDLIAPAGILCPLKAKSKKQALQSLASLAADLTEFDERNIFDTLMTRERLGSTGLGRGVAIPHGKVPGLTGMMGLFARTQEPIAFDAPDDAPVDLIVVLLAPEGAGAEHLKALARVSRLLRDTESTDRLRAAQNADDVYAILTDGQHSQAA